MGDVQDPEKLRRTIARAYEQQYHLLDMVGALQSQVSALTQQGAGNSRTLNAVTAAILTGSTDNPLPGQKAVIPNVTTLPDVNTATDGDVVWFGGAQYRFDSTTKTWLAGTLPTTAVTTNTVQTIGPGAAKTFADLVTAGAGLTVSAGVLNAINALFSGTLGVTGLTTLAAATLSGTLTSNGALIANSFVQLLSGIQLGVTTVSVSPHTQGASEVFMRVTALPMTINLIAGPGPGGLAIIKDDVGTAGASNITVNGNGKNIDGAATKVISTNYGSLSLIYNGTQHNIW